MRRAGLRAYLGFPGGISLPGVLGSVATDVAAGVGGLDGQAIAPGDRLQSKIKGDGASSTSWPTIHRGHVLRVMPGVRLSRFSGGAFAQLLTREFTVSPDSNNIGLRLTGDPIDSQ